jgi:hypothetical protein
VLFFFLVHFFCSSSPPRQREKGGEETRETQVVRLLCGGHPATSQGDAGRKRDFPKTFGEVKACWAQLDAQQPGHLFPSWDIVVIGTTAIGTCLVPVSSRIWHCVLFLLPSPHNYTTQLLVGCHSTDRRRMLRCARRSGAHQVGLFTAPTMTVTSSLSPAASCGSPFVQTAWGRRHFASASTKPVKSALPYRPVHKLLIANRGDPFVP